MKKFLLWFIAPLTTLTIIVFFLMRDKAPAGEGSYSEAKEIYAILGKINIEDKDEKLPKGCLKFGNKTQLRYIAMATDSHNMWGGGGTIGLLFPDGSRHIFFGHVCGPGPTPLEFRGKDKQEILTGVEDSWTEYHF